ncbi:MAG: thioredoxin-disulfide reductase [Spirochaetes bacterium]|nr:thioredoxin-disulfide reductase [Spirochaetota bacterium]
MYDLIIIGGGPGGLTAAIYGARFGLSTLVLEKQAAGGQINLTESIENYPGFDEPIFGYELSQKMERQALKFGAKIIYEEVIDVDFSKEIKIVKTNENQYSSRTVIISTGAYPKRLFIPGEEEYIGRGISFCGTCDGPLFKGKKVAVIGGGDTALEESIIISKWAEKVYLIHRRDRFKGQKILQEKVFNNNKIKILFNCVPLEFYGEQLIKGVKIKKILADNKEEISNLSIDGVFIFIGHLPNTKIFEGKVELSDEGFIKVDRNMKTNVSGIYACGDVVEKELRQVTISVGEGALAAYEAYKYVQK